MIKITDLLKKVLPAKKLSDEEMQNEAKASYERLSLKAQKILTGWLDYEKIRQKFDDCYLFSGKTPDNNDEERYEELRSQGFVSSDWGKYFLTEKANLLV